MLPHIKEYTDVPLGGQPTLVVFHRYVDRHVLFVTQLPTFGTLVEAHSDRHLDGTETAMVRVLLGDSDAEIPPLCARVIMEAMRAGPGGTRVPLLLGLGLKQECCTGEVVKEVVAFHKEKTPWVGGGE